MINLGALSETRGNSADLKGVRPTPSTASYPEKPAAQRRKNIQAIDLSYNGDQNKDAQHRPREYRKSHGHRTNMNNGLSVPISRARTQTFSCAARSQPQISFLNCTVSTSNPNDKTSSVHGEVWMDDLPSPSLLLDNNRSNSKRLLGSNLSSQVANEAALEGNLTSSHADHENDENPGIISNDEIRKTNDINPHRSATDQRGTGTPPLPGLPRAAFGPWEGIKSIESDGRLFFSTDNPQQTTSPLEKRKLAAGPELMPLREMLDTERRSRTFSPEIFGNSSQNDFHKAKKRRVSDSSIDQIFLLSTDDGVSQSQSSPKASGPSDEAPKGPQPLWADECDADFVWEGADFMEFKMNM